MNGASDEVLNVKIDILTSGLADTWRFEMAWERGDPDQYQEVAV